MTLWGRAGGHAPTPPQTITKTNKQRTRGMRGKSGGWWRERVRGQEPATSRRVEEGHGGHATDRRVPQTVIGLIEVTVARPRFVR